jgi:hypothetical protein
MIPVQKNVNNHKLSINILNLEDITYFNVQYEHVLWICVNDIEESNVYSKFPKNVQVEFAYFASCPNNYNNFEIDEILDFSTFLI